MLCSRCRKPRQSVTPSANWSRMSWSARLATMVLWFMTLTFDKWSAIFAYIASGAEEHNPLSATCTLDGLSRGQAGGLNEKNDDWSASQSKTGRDYPSLPIRGSTQGPSPPSAQNATSLRQHRRFLGRDALTGRALGVEGHLLPAGQPTLTACLSAKRGLGRIIY